MTFHRPSCSFNGDEESTQVRLVETSFIQRSEDRRQRIQFKHKRKGTLERHRRSEEFQQVASRIQQTQQESANETLRTRKRAARELTAYGAVISICWFPYVAAVMSSLFWPKHPTLMLIKQIFLLFGHAHSTVNPGLYYLMNKNNLKCPCGCANVNFLRRGNEATNASSTNEAALGPFHPRYIRPREPRPQPQRRSSSFMMFFD